MVDPIPTPLADMRYSASRSFADIQDEAPLTFNRYGSVNIGQSEIANPGTSPKLEAMRESTNIDDRTGQPGPPIIPGLTTENMSSTMSAGDAFSSGLTRIANQVRLGPNYNENDLRNDMNTLFKGANAGTQRAKELNAALNPIPVMPK